MSRVLVVGPHGMLGSAMTRGLARAGLDVVPLGRAQHDILGDPIETIPLAGVAHVVNCAGLINRYEGSRPPGDFYLINSIFPRRLADACERAGARLFHISTDCVFDGTGAPHDEAARPNPHDLYGRSKLYGEPANAMVLRTSVIGPECAHFHSLLCWFLAVEQRCQGYVNHLWSGMTTLALAGVVAHLVASDGWRRGIFHVPGETITKHDLLRAIARAFRHDVAIEPTTAPVARDMRLATRHPDLLVGYAIPPLDAQLRDLAALCDAKGRWPAAQ